MKCPKWGKDMKSGYLQTERIVAFNKRKHKISMNPECKDDVMIVRRHLWGQTFQVLSVKNAA